MTYLYMFSFETSKFKYPVTSSKAQHTHSNFTISEKEMCTLNKTTACHRSAKQSIITGGTVTGSDNVLLKPSFKRSNQINN